jgi:hypothetical protein
MLITQSTMEGVSLRTLGLGFALGAGAAVALTHLCSVSSAASKVCVVHLTRFTLCASSTLDVPHMHSNMHTQAALRGRS